MLTSAFTCSDQDVGVSQQRGHRRAFDALRDGKGGLRRLRATCAFAPVLGSVPAQPSSPGSVRPLRSRRLAPARLCTHVCTHLGGDLRGLQYAELQSWEENTDVSLLLETASLQSAFPSGFSFQPGPFHRQRPQGCSNCVWGHRSSGQGERWLPALLPREGAAKLPVSGLC